MLMSISEPLFSIILPTYNRALTLPRAIESILRQSYEDWELIVIDNESSDNSIQIVHEYGDPRISLYVSAQIGSIAKSRNLGAMKAKADWLCFLDSDDTWVRDKLKLLTTLIEDNDIIYHDMTIRDKSSGKSKTSRSRKLSKPIYEDLLLNGNTLINSTVSIRKSIFFQVDGQCEDLKMFAIEDYDCWLRVSKLTEKFYYLKKNLGVYEVSQESAGSRNSISYLTEGLSSHLNELNDYQLGRFYSLYKFQILRSLEKDKPISAALRLAFHLIKFGKFKLKVKGIVAFILWLTSRISFVK